MLRPGMTLGMAIVLLMGGAPVPAPASDPFAFILSARAIAPADRARLDAGDTLIKVLPANNPELAVFGATRIDVDADRLLAWARQVEELYKGPYMPVIRRFSSPPHHDDLAAFTLSDKDLADIRTCRLGNCGVKLSGPEIERLQQATAVAGADWKSATQRAFRDIVLARARYYLAHGYCGSQMYDDHKVPVLPEAEFTALTKPSSPASLAFPQLTTYLTRFPRLEDPDVESFLYWSKDTLGRKESISVTHLSIVRPADPALPEAFIVSRQVFASHYVTGSIGITAITRAAPGAPRYLLYLNRSRIDILDGPFAGLARRLIEHRIKAEAPASLRALRHRLESGAPPQ